MPIFEFICQECGAPFEELLRSADVISEVCCPECGSKRVKKRISTFAARMTGGRFTSTGSGSNASVCTSGSV